MLVSNDGLSHLQPLEDITAAQFDEMLAVNLRARRPGPAARQVPAGRLGRPSQVTDLAAAILAKAYLTNQVISLDGGIYPRYAPDGVHHGVRTSRPGSR